MTVDWPLTVWTITKKENNKERTKGPPEATGHGNPSGKSHTTPFFLPFFLSVDGRQTFLEHPRVPVVEYNYAVKTKKREPRFLSLLFWNETQIVFNTKRKGRRRIGTRRPEGFSGCLSSSASSHASSLSPSKRIQDDKWLSLCTNRSTKMSLSFFPITRPLVRRRETQKKKWKKFWESCKIEKKAGDSVKCTTPLKEKRRREEGGGEEDEEEKGKRERERERKRKKRAGSKSPLERLKSPSYENKENHHHQAAANLSSEILLLQYFSPSVKTRG